MILLEGKNSFFIGRFIYIYIGEEELMTQSTERFLTLLKEATDRYKRALEAKTPENQIKHAKVAEKNLKAALKMADLVNLPKKKPHIYEYLTLCQNFIGKAYKKIGRPEPAIDYFTEARHSNRKTFNNEQTYIRELLILEELLDYARKVKNQKQTLSLADKMLPLVKKLSNPEEKVRYYILLKNSYVEAKHLGQIKKTYKLLLELAKKIGGDYERAKALIYVDYANYLKVVLNKKTKSQKYYTYAEKIFRNIGNIEEANEIHKNLENWE